MLISIVSPVFNEAHGIGLFCAKLSNLFESTDYDLEIILCVDPSNDGTEDIIGSIHEEDGRVKLISFSRRIGQDKATQAGIDFAQGDAVIVMDCDLQDPVETILDFLREWRAGAKVVYAKRVSRGKDNPIKKLTANIFYRVLNKFAEVEIPRNTGDFRLMDKCVVLELRKYKENSFFLRALTPLVGYPTKEVEIARQERSVGETKYNRFFGGVKTAMIAIYGYTNVIQKLFLGLSLFFFSNLALFVLTFLILDLTPEVTPKILFCVLMILGFSVLFVISLAAWLMTSYLDRIYKQSLNRPNYTIAYSVGFND